MSMLRNNFSAVLIAASACLTVSPLSAQPKTGLAMMKVETGARASGLAGAYVSIGGDPLSAAYNPAGVQGISRFSVALSHNEYWSNIRLESGYFATPLKGRFTLHGSIRYAALGNIEVRQTPTSEPDALADAHDISFKAGLGYRVSSKLYAGFGAGWFIEKISSFRGSAFNLDLGLIATPRPNLNIGASITNIGSDFSLQQQNAYGSRMIALPITYRLGASYSRNHLLGAADLVVLDDQAHLHLGMEKQIRRYFAVRAGYMFNYDTKGLTTGVSFTRRNLTIDYAFVPYSSSIDDSHQFTFTFGL
jgi:hypothetical protein